MNLTAKQLRRVALKLGYRVKEGKKQEASLDLR